MILFTKIYSKNSYKNLLRLFKLILKTSITNSRICAHSQILETEVSFPNFICCGIVAMLWTITCDRLALQKDGIRVECGSELTNNYSWSKFYIFISKVAMNISLYGDNLIGQNLARLPKLPILKRMLQKI